MIFLSDFFKRGYGIEALSLTILVSILLALVVVAPELAAHEKGIVAPKAWTFMIYLGGDNDLEGAGIDDLNEMEVPVEDYFRTAHDLFIPTDLI
ncbi:hypothetical protein KAV67_01945 [Candidatus Bipolaricaulota bacterium]|nr:hypothetical protein [Candidatus Bipolaricaulota bacterium]